MQKIIQITDLHLRAPGAKVLGLDPTERLKSVIHSVNQNHSDADLCVFTGDLTDEGDERAYALLKACLAGLRVPCRLLLGNHDKRSVFLRVFPQAHCDENGHVQSTLRVGGAACMFLDTLDEAQPGKGLLCGQRLSWLDDQLAGLTGERLIVFMHHPPFSIGLTWFDDMLLDNGEQVMDRLQRHRGLVHIAFGHVHVNTSGSWRGISYSASRGTCHKILSDLSAEQAHYVDGGPAYDILLVDEHRTCVHSIDPAGPNALIAREFPTADGRGSMELLDSARAQRWV